MTGTLTSCTCYVDGFEAECPLIDTAGYPQHDCGYLSLPGGGGTSGANPEQLLPDLTPVGSLFVFFRTSEFGARPATTLHAGHRYAGQVVVVNRGGTNTSAMPPGSVIDEGSSKIVRNLAVRIFLRAIDSGASYDLLTVVGDFRLMPPSPRLGSPVPTLIDFDGVLPDSVPPGKYRLAATVDFTNVLVESDESPNSNTRQGDEDINVLAAPRLISVPESGSVSSQINSEPTPRIGIPYRVYSRIRNEGTAPISGSFTVEYFANPENDDPLGPTSVRLGQVPLYLENLQPGHERSVEFVSSAGLPPLRAGVGHELRASIIASKGETVRERDLIGAFTPQPAETLRPDLEPIESDALAVTHLLPDGSISTTEPLKVRFTIRNNGGALPLYELVTVSFRLIGVAENADLSNVQPVDRVIDVRTFKFPSEVGLGASQSYEVSFTGAPGGPLNYGQYVLEVEVDTKSRVAEFDEANNTKRVARVMLLRPPAGPVDLAIDPDGVELPEGGASPNEHFAFSVRIVNLGAQAYDDRLFGLTSKIRCGEEYHESNVWVSPKSFPPGAALERRLGLQMPAKAQGTCELSISLYDASDVNQGNNYWFGDLPVSGPDLTIHPHLEGAGPHVFGEDIILSAFVGPANVSLPRDTAYVVEMTLRGPVVRVYRVDENTGPYGEGSSITFDLPASDLPTGVYDVELRVDVTNAIAEANEANNVRAFGSLYRVEVRPKPTNPGPDLRPDGVEAYADFATFVPGITQVQPRMIIVAVQNTAQATATLPSGMSVGTRIELLDASGNAYVWCDGNVTLMKGIPPGGTHFMLNATPACRTLLLPRGQYVLRLTFDPHNAIAEADEGNNTAPMSVLVVP